MMSLNMLIEFGDAFDFTGADFRAWCEDAGFTQGRGAPARRARQRGDRLQVARI